MAHSVGSQCHHQVDCEGFWSVQYIPWGVPFLFTSSLDEVPLYNPEKNTYHIISEYHFISYYIQSAKCYWSSSYPIQKTGFWGGMYFRYIYWWVPDTRNNRVVFESTWFIQKNQTTSCAQEHPEEAEEQLRNGRRCWWRMWDWCILASGFITSTSTKNKQIFWA